MASERISAASPLADRRLEREAAVLGRSSSVRKGGGLHFRKRSAELPSTLSRLGNDDKGCVADFSDLLGPEPFLTHLAKIAEPLGAAETRGPAGRTDRRGGRADGRPRSTDQ